MSTGGLGQTGLDEYWRVGTDRVRWVLEGWEEENEMREEPLVPGTYVYI